MPFFDPAPESEDLQLLPVSVRKDEDLAAIADECETAVLAFYTGLVRPAVPLTHPVYLSVVPDGAYALDATEGLYVFLRGYDATVADCEARLAAALKREIAGVIRWRRSQWRGDPTSASESSGQGASAKSFREDKNAMFPQTFGLHLRPFDLRPVPTAI